MPHAYRASILRFLADPSVEAQAYEYFDDGLLLVEGGKVQALGPYASFQAQVDPARFNDFSGRLLLPGFIDTHVHFPQTEMIGAYGEGLLTWLDKYTFPTEQKFADKGYARAVAEVFLDELLRSGTTTALVFATVHKASVEALFEASEPRNLRLIAGKVLMDRNAPSALCDTPEAAYADSAELIARFHGRGRLLYAITPRFLGTSSPAQLTQAARLVRDYPSCYLHTHVAESTAEVAWIEGLFRGVTPSPKSYLELYDHYGLMTERSVFAHGVHLSDPDFALLGTRASALSFCPTSNLFLGSGLFRLRSAKRHEVKLGVGTDVGAGTSFSLLQTLNEAYKVQRLQDETLPALEAFYQITLGASRALGLEDRVGSLKPGSEADFVLLDPAATPLLSFRMGYAESLEERLFVWMTLGDDRAIERTYVAGALAHQR